MDNFNIKIYETELTYDKPISYLPVATDNLKNELIQIYNKVNKTQEDNEKFEKINKYLESQMLKIYPFLIKDYFNFFSNIRFLQIRKNETPDPKVISMKYLDFLFYLAKKNNDNRYIQSMVSLLSTCLKTNNDLKVDNIKYNQDSDGHIVLILNNVKCTWKDFDNIRRIICYQNILDYDDGYVDPKFRVVIEEAERFKNKKIKQASLEELMSCLVVSSGYKYEELYNMSIRKFYITLRRAGYKLDYQIIKTGIANGTIKSDINVQNWTESLSNKDKYSDMLVDFDEFKNKINKTN